MKKVALLYGVKLVKFCFMCYNINTLNLTALTSEGYEGAELLFLVDLAVFNIDCADLGQALGVGVETRRLGVKDDERAGESISIENQRLMLTKYVEEKGWKIAGEYVDDGYTGTNFDRPEVQRLIDDVHMGRLDIVIVKDLSRFGRNYIEVGRYIDYEFPLYNIRFIALSDNIDTADKNSTAMDMMPIMNVFNEWHCANTSKKIRAVKESNAKTGKYAASIAAYG